MSDLLKTYREMDTLMGQGVHLTHSQVLEITVKELVNKYQHHKSTDLGFAFRRVLEFYLTEDELNQVLSLDSDISKTSIVGRKK